MLRIKVYVLEIRYCLTTNCILIKQAGYRLTVSEVCLNNVRHIINANLGIEDALRLDNDNGALLAEAMTTSEINLHLIQTQLGGRIL